MTELERIEKLEKEILSPQDVAKFLHCTPYTINIQCKKDISKIQFPITYMGNRVRIPKSAFVAWAKGKST